MPFSSMKTLRTLSLAASMLACLSFSTPAAQAAQPLKIGTVVWIGYGPFYVAEALDLYKKYGLSVKLQFFNDPGLLPAALTSHSVDGAMLTYDQVIGSDAKGMKQKVVMPIDFSNGGDAIVATADVRKVADFKGKKIAFNPLSPSDFLLAYALQTNGLSDKDITAVNMTPEAIPGAMVSGSLPVGVTYEPNVSQILSADKNKFHVVYSSRNAPGLIADVLVFEQSYIDAHPTEVKGILQAYADGMAYMKSHPDEANRIIGKALGISADEVKSQLDGVYNIPTKEMPQSFVKGPTTRSYFTSGAVIGGLLQKKGQISAPPAIETTIDAQFVNQLVK
ncbi:ABC transporter substrate-binding protein [Paraburkholderia strydomiana]|jgi:NitT/TauT family transport system substrate-binding protein|uniref:ABC transporter substrate-binding protein n=1 Tax=Paraburkholderia strydomiana TaxID=1245417 RepID=A0ABW9EDR9_9BURK